MTDILIIALVLLAVALAIRKIINDKKKGSCCGSCPGCGACKAALKKNN